METRPADHMEALVGIAAYLTVTGRIDEAAVIVRQLPSLRRGVLWLAQYLLNDSLEGNQHDERSGGDGG